VGELTLTTRTIDGEDGNGGLMKERSCHDEAGNCTGVLQGGTGQRLVSTYDALLCLRLLTCTENQDGLPRILQH